MPLIMKKTINGQPVKIRLTADVGSGNPVGTILPLYKKSNPIGYLYCDGSTFDETVYPALYAYLGTNVLPDYREFALVGAEENTTDVYNASTNPTGTIHDHDTYTEGQAKDDQLQDHKHFQRYGVQYYSTGSGTWASLGNTDTDSIITGAVDNRNYRTGTVTRGKRKAVFFYIKATSGVMESNTENFINVINEERSYSTSEVNTGKKWIDGKPIYRKVTVFSSLLTVQSNTWTTTEVSNSGIETIINISGINEYGANFPIAGTRDQGDYIKILSYRNHDITVETLILEYTKTTNV